MPTCPLGKRKNRVLMRKGNLYSIYHRATRFKTIYHKDKDINLLKQVHPTRITHIFQYFPLKAPTSFILPNSKEIDKR